MDRFKKVGIAFLSVLLLGITAFGQRTEISIGLSEHFFDTLMDAVFTHSDPLKFSIAGNFSPLGLADNKPSFMKASFGQNEQDENRSVCDESVRLVKETSGIRTAVRFRDGQILAPLAFTGNYNPPLVGCVAFSGWAESNVELSFDEEGQRLIAKAKVNGVHLNGTGGVGNSLIGRMVQNSIDKRINPIEIIRLDKISMMLPLQNSANIRMKAVGISHEIHNEVLVIRIAYEFQKA
ncbi:MAG: hypothetical protein KF685_03770 [Acidobacteria bacterium]|nr:hypothetical protein [Acidobacteriota bacterium]